MIFTRPSRHRVHGRLRQLVHLHEPLVGQIAARSASSSGRNGPGRSRGPRPRPTRPCSSRSATTLLRGFVDRQALVRPGVLVERAVGIEDVDHRQLLPQADLVVVRIVGRRDLDAAAAQLGLGPLVGDQRNLAVQQRQHHLAAVGGHVAQLDQLRQHACCGARPSVVQLVLERRASPCPAPRPAGLVQFRFGLVQRGGRDRDARPRPCRRASSRAAWWRWSRASARPAAGR